VIASRAGISTFGRVVNQSLAPVATRDPALAALAHSGS
jgi:hypothetical protein